MTHEKIHELITIIENYRIDLIVSTGVIWVSYRKLLNIV